MLKKSVQLIPCGIPISYTTRCKNDRYGVVVVMMILIVMLMEAGMTADGDDLIIMVKNVIWRWWLQLPPQAGREAKSNCPDMMMMMMIMIGMILIVVMIKIIIMIMIIITSSWSRSKEQLSGRGRAKRSTTTAAWLDNWTIMKITMIIVKDGHDI